MIYSTWTTKADLQKSRNSLEKKSSITHCGRPALHPSSQRSSASSLPMRKRYVLHEAKKKWEQKPQTSAQKQHIALRHASSSFLVQRPSGNCSSPNFRSWFGVAHAGTLTFLVRPLRSRSLNPVHESRSLGWRDSLSHHAAWQGVIGQEWGWLKWRGYRNAVFTDVEKRYRWIRFLFSRNLLLLEARSRGGFLRSGKGRIGTVGGD